MIGLLLAMLDSYKTATSNVRGYSDRTATSNVRGGLQ